MAKQNSAGQNFTNNTDGWDLSGGTTSRKLTQTGGDITINAGNSNTYTYPTATSTLWGDDRIKMSGLSSDATTNSTTTGVKITGLDTALSTGRWVFQYFIRYQAAAATTGAKFGINFTGSSSAFMALARLATDGTTAVSATADQSTTTTPTIMGSLAVRAVSTTAPNIGPWTAIDTANADMMVVIEGMIVVTGTGNIELWHGSEVAAASTVKEGTGLIATKVA